MPKNTKEAKSEEKKIKEQEKLESKNKKTKLKSKIEEKKKDEVENKSVQNKVIDNIKNFISKIIEMQEKVRRDLEEEKRNLIYNHVIKKEPLCNYALRNDVELEDIDVIYKNAIVLLKEIFMDNYYKKAKICS